MAVPIDKWDAHLAKILPLSSGKTLHVFGNKFPFSFHGTFSPHRLRPKVITR